MENLVTLDDKPRPTYADKSPFSLEILLGEDVFKKFLSREFIEDWTALHKNCPWATVYQSFDFIYLWYKHYHIHYLPILILSSDQGKLNGVFPLCRGKNKTLKAAGLSQAEYQTWISTVTDGDEFIQMAIKKLWDRFPDHALQLKFLPHSTPLDWTQTNSFWKKTIWIESCEQPIMVIRKEHLVAELRKKNKREKVNRLKRLGELKFERITDDEEFSSIYDELASQNDFRKAAVYNVSSHDPSLNKSFLLALFKHKLLHATVLKIDDDIIASNVGTIGGKWVHLQGLNSHSPAHSKHSPGILHFLMLGQLMAEEGFEIFDLTPGTDSYKNALATDYITAHKLYFASASSIKVKKLKFLLWKKSKSYLQKMGVSQLRQRSFKNNLIQAVEKAKLVKNHGLPLLLNHISWNNIQTEQNYMIPSGNGTSYSPSLTIKKNAIRDLLDFKPGHSLHTKKEFLEHAMKMIESGFQFFTLCKDSKLMCCVWQENTNGQKAGSLPSSDHSSLRDLYFHPMEEKFVREFLVRVSNIIKKEDDRQPFTVLKASNRKNILLLERSGFRQAL